MAKTERWRENTSGKCPPSLKGTDRRVRVRLRNGRESKDAWPADGKHPKTRWTLIGSPFDITHYLAED